MGSSTHSPLRYPGGKNCIFSFMSSLISENGLLGCKYIEPYAGGAGLALRLLFEEYVESIVINDLDPLVNAFWQVCVQDNARLVDWIDKTPVNVETWKECKMKVGSGTGTERFELAASFFFLNRTNVSGVLNGGVIGGLDQSGKYKINARYNKNELIRRVLKIGRFKERIEISNQDGLQLLSKFAKPRSVPAFIYIDPPYYEKGSNLYMNYYKESDHESLSLAIRNLKSPWLISYDNHPFIVNLYEGYGRRAYRLQHSTSNKIGNEVVVFSPMIAFDESLQHLSDVVAV